MSDHAIPNPAPKLAAMRPLALAVLALALAGCGSQAPPRGGDWPVPNGDLHGTRAAPASALDRGSVGRLVPAGRFRLHARNDSGAVTATPVVAGSTVYLQDMRSNVLALDLATGAVRWRHRIDLPAPGPNGVAVAGGRVFGTTDTDV